ncbi:hypothetical protein DB41_FX00050 [Neochlamydia sp. TUME1]|nr:hypothetical protein [Neochlamydia sp. TUME1]KIC76496.1 hypothetical protein DB41_FX00050 [Neochlamydia sp. TUME1]
MQDIKSKLATFNLTKLISSNGNKLVKQFLTSQLKKLQTCS